MTYTEILEFINSLHIFKSKLPIYLKNHYPDIYQEIISCTKFLDNTDPGDKNGISFQSRIYCIQNNLYDRPKCPNCGKNYLKFRTDIGKFRNYCSYACSRYNEDVKKKREQTTYERYGDKFYHNIDKSRKTRNERYGGWCDSTYRDKVKKTLFERYGNENYVNWEKAKETNNKKYGVDSPLMSSSIREKCKESFRMNHPGCNSPMDLPGVKEKLRISNREKSWRFIVDNPLVEPMFDHNFYLNVDDLNADDALQFKCKKCGKIFSSWWYAGRARSCPTCFPNAGSSHVEKQIYEFIESINPNRFNVYNKKHINRQIIPPKEIDIVVCNKNDEPLLLFEIDGLFFHSSEYMKKDVNYHLNKTIMCESKNLQLVHIFENEWVSNSEIVKSRIRNLLGSYDKTIFARKCLIKEVQKPESDMFIHHNHIQGVVNSSINIGLFYENELISMMTFSKCRFNKQYEYELLRFCNKIGYHIPGAASKLLKYFERKYNPSSIISYADRRWSTGKLYKSIGFTLNHISKPNYWYFKTSDSSKLYNRIKFQKHNLKKLLPKFDESLSEVENMVLNGYDRIFDCGNLVFEKIFKTKTAEE